MPRFRPDWRRADRKFDASGGLIALFPSQRLDALASNDSGAAGFLAASGSVAASDLAWGEFDAVGDAGPDEPMESDSRHRRRRFPKSHQNARTLTWEVSRHHPIPVVIQPRPQLALRSSVRQAFI